MFRHKLSVCSKVNKSFLISSVEYVYMSTPPRIKDDYKAIADLQIIYNKTFIIIIMYHITLVHTLFVATKYKEEKYYYYQWFVICQRRSINDIFCRFKVVDGSCFRRDPIFLVLVLKKRMRERERERIFFGNSE